MNKQGGTYRGLLKWIIVIVIGAVALFYLGIGGSERYTGGGINWIIYGILGILAIYAIIRYARLNKEEREIQNKKISTGQLLSGTLIKPEIPYTIITAILGLAVGIYILFKTPFKSFGWIAIGTATAVIIVSVVSWKFWAKE